MTFEITELIKKIFINNTELVKTRHSCYLIYPKYTIKLFLWTPKNAYISSVIQVNKIKVQ